MLLGEERKYLFSERGGEQEETQKQMERAPGFRFYPTEEELISFYLHNKLHGNRQDLDSVIPVLCIYEFNPSDLPQLAGERCRNDPEQWFFFIPRLERELMGRRPTRLTPAGYWKAAGSRRYVYSLDNRAIGIKRDMVFYLGRFPTGRKTEWKMNEYRAIEVDPRGVVLKKIPIPISYRLLRLTIRVYYIKGENSRP
ncbi:unnamed protein product [Thlaspi arvense]|uniref:NAC domain-containing protein n=1 Tax=Thlaspi arvense TaxID=13288 RepID=A0AAU9S369_THLAR|nr:unnamed protein product [Thlaspi arvense]